SPSSSQPTHPSSTKKTDDLRQLLDSARAGNADACQRLYDRYSAHVLTVVRHHLGHPLRRAFDSADLTPQTWQAVFTEFANGNAGRDGRQGRHLRQNDPPRSGTQPQERLRGRANGTAVPSRLKQLTSAPPAQLGKLKQLIRHGVRRPYLAANQPASPTVADGV